MKKCIFFLWAIILLMVSGSADSQSLNDSLLQNATLQNCISYAMAHQPQIQQSLLDEQITEHTIKSKLADWYPQIDFSYNLQHYFRLPTSVFQGNAVKLGVENTSTAGFSLTQKIFDKDVLLASRTASDVRTQVKQATENNKIDLSASVSKAFYDVLLTRKQMDLVEEDIVRLQQSLTDAYNQYTGGIVDKTDYKRATISLNNARAQKKQYEELLKGKYAYLDELMGLPDDQTPNLVYDTSKMEKEVFLDTSLTVNYENRIEYSILQTQKKLQEANLKYYKWDYIPSVSAFGNYNLSYLNNQFSKLYSTTFPNSYAGLTLSFPLFEGGKRTQQIKTAELQLKRVDYDILTLKNAVNTEYTQALAVYKSNLNDFLVLKDNVALAFDVYNTIQLQYKAGIKTYLDVITAETDLRSSEVNYTNALYQVLSSKIDVEKALGTLQY